MNKKSNIIIGFIIVSYAIFLFIAFDGITFQNKPLPHSFFLLSTVLLGVFSIYTAVQCYKSNINNKWTWIVIILVGVGRFQLDWHMGTFSFNIVSMAVPSFNILKSYSNKMLSVICYVPVGLLIYYARIFIDTKRNIAES